MIQPEEIIEEIKKRPPAQRRMTGENYLGLKVNWKLQFMTIDDYFTQSEDELDVCAAKENSSAPWINFVVNIKKYPEFNILKEKDNIWVEGKISRVSESLIKLENCAFKFKDENEHNIHRSNQYFVNSKIHLDNRNIKANNILPGAIIKNNKVTGGATLIKVLNTPHKEKEENKKFWERPWFHAIILLSALATITSVLLSSLN